MSSKKKLKQISIEEYVETYCQEKRIRERFAVYISSETHRKLKRIAQLFRYKYYTTTSSLADSIISHHINMYRELLNAAQKEDDREFFERKERKMLNEGEESEFDEEENGE